MDGVRKSATGRGGRESGSSELGRASGSGHDWRWWVGVLVV